MENKETMDPRMVAAILRASMTPSCNWRHQSLAKFGRAEEDPKPRPYPTNPHRVCRMVDGRRCEIWSETCKIEIIEPPLSSPLPGDTIETGATQASDIQDSMHASDSAINTEDNGSQYEDRTYLGMGGLWEENREQKNEFLVNI